MPREFTPEELKEFEGMENNYKGLGISTTKDWHRNRISNQYPGFCYVRCGKCCGYPKKGCCENCAMQCLLSNGLHPYHIPVYFKGKELLKSIEEHFIVKYIEIPELSTLDYFLKDFFETHEDLWKAWNKMDSRQKEQFEWMLKYFGRNCAEVALSNASKLPVKMEKVPYTGVRAGNPETAWYPAYVPDEKAIKDCFTLKDII